MKLTEEEIIKELKFRKSQAKDDLQEIRQDNIHTPSYNLGYFDSLGEFLEWIDENEE